MNNRKWASSGRYGITRGVYKRLWEPKPSLSAVIVPSPVLKNPSGGGGEFYILTESYEEMMTESGVGILPESVVVE